MSSGVIGWLFEMVMGVRLAQGGADQAPIAQEAGSGDSKMPASWGKAAEKRGSRPNSLQIHRARLDGAAIAAEGGKIVQEFLGR